MCKHCDTAKNIAEALPDEMRGDDLLTALAIFIAAVVPQEDVMLFCLTLTKEALHISTIPEKRMH